MRTSTTAALLALILLGAPACQQKTEDIEEIKEQTRLILAKLEDLERKMNNMQPARRGPAPDDYSKVYEIDLGKAPIKGNPDAPVTLVEWSEFQCPYCFRANGPIFELLEKYPDKLRVVYKHFPLGFHKEARPLAIASLAAQEQGCFWQFHDATFASAGKRELSAEKAEEYAKEAGCDVERFKADLEKNKDVYAKRIDADYKQGQGVAVRGTPTLYINGKKVRDRSVAGMSAMVEEALKSPEG